jgi:hypothetical protein
VVNHDRTMSEAVCRLRALAAEQDPTISVVRRLRGPFLVEDLGDAGVLAR